MQDLDRARNGSCKKWILREMDCTRFRWCKICIVQEMNHTIDLNCGRNGSYKIWMSSYFYSLPILSICRNSWKAVRFTMSTYFENNFNPLCIYNIHRPLWIIWCGIAGPLRLVLHCCTITFSLHLLTPNFVHTFKQSVWYSPVDCNQ